MEDFIAFWLKAVSTILTRYFSVAGIAFVLFYIIFRRPMISDSEAV